MTGPAIVQSSVVVPVAQPVEYSVDVVSAPA